MTEGFDVGLEMSGNPAALHDMLANMAHGGRIAMLGIPAEEIAIDWNRVIFNMLTIRGIYGREMYETWYAMTVMLQSGLDISPVITHRFPLRRIRAGLRCRRERRERQGRARLGAVMFEGVREQFQGELDEIAAAGLGKQRARDRLGAGRARDARRRARAAQPVRQQLPRPRQPPGRARRGRATRSASAATAWRRCASSAARRTSTASSSSASASSSAARTRSSTRPASTPTRASSRRCSARTDAIISDALNHASIIDGVRLCKARRLRYANGDTDELEQRLREASDARRRLIATDGVFSMDGHVAPLARICELAEQYDAMVMVDDSHAVGFIGPDGRGTPALHGVAERVDLITGTLGKALGGASGGFTSGRREAIELLRQRSRPYLFSNSLAPPIVAASLAVLDLLESEGAALRERLFAPHGALPPRARGARPRRRAGRAPDRPGDVRRRAPRRAPPPRRCSSTASTPSRSPTRSCRWARRASARSSPPRSPTRTSTAPSRPSPRSRAASAA